MTTDIESLPVAEFAFPGAPRDRLVAAILAGEKTTTTGLLEEYEQDGTAIPEPGSLQALVDSDGRRIAVLQIWPNGFAWSSNWVDREHDR